MPWGHSLLDPHNSLEETGHTITTTPYPPPRFPGEKAKVSGTPHHGRKFRKDTRSILADSISGPLGGGSTLLSTISYFTEQPRSLCHSSMGGRIHVGRTLGCGPQEILRTHFLSKCHRSWGGDSAIKIHPEHRVWGQTLRLIQGSMQVFLG